MRDPALTPAMTVRAEAMRLAIACVERFQDATFADVIIVSEEIEQWLYEAEAPALVRAAALPDGWNSWKPGTSASEGNGHA